MRILNRFINQKSFPFLILIPYTYFTFITASGIYAKTDDYVFFGIIKADQLTWLKSIELFITSPWNAGRWISSVIISSIYYLTPDVESLKYTRIAAIFLTLLLAYYIYWVVEKITKSRSLAIVSQIILLSLPGIHSFVTLVASVTYILATGFGVVGSYILFLYFKTGKMNHFIFSTFFGLLACFTYQPATFLLCTCALIGIGRSIIYVKSRVLILMILMIQPFAILAVNSLSINIVGSSGRNTLQIPNIEKFHYYFKFIFGTVVTPWVRLEDFSNYGALVALVICTLSILIMIQFGFFRSISKMRSQRIADIFLKICVIFGGLPLTNSWILLIEERAIDFRRYFFSSLTYYLVVFSALQYLLANKAFRIVKVAKCASVLMLLLLGFFTLNINMSTAAILEREWKAYLCASNAVAIGENVKIERSLVLAQNYSETPNDDFKTMSSYYPNPPSFLLWLSQRQSREVSFLPWNMNLIEKSEQLAFSPDGIRWGQAFQACSLKERG